MEKQQITITVPRVNLQGAWRFAQKWLLPNPGTLVLMLVLLLTVPALAGTLQGINATSVLTIPYQGRLADASGNPVTGKQNMEFRIYNVPTDGAPLWEEFWTGANSVDVSDGLFSVMLGSINTGLPAVVQGNNNLYLGITVGTDSEMVPRVQLGSVPFSIWSLTVADDSVTSRKIANGAIESRHIALGNGFATHYRGADPFYRQGRNGDWVDLPDSDISITLDVPSVVLVEVSLKGYQAHTEGSVLFTVNCDGIDLHSADYHNQETPMIPRGESTTGYHYVFNLEPGTHTFKIRVANTDAVAGDWRVFESRITAMAWGQ